MPSRLLQKQEKVISNAGKTAKEIQLKFRQSVAAALITAVGILAALSWQATIKVYLDFLISQLNVAVHPFFYNLYSSLIITFFAAIVIMIVSKWAAKEPEKKAGAA